MDDNASVLVLTCNDDVTADVVIAELNTRRVPVVRLDPAELGKSAELSARIGGGVESWHGWLRTPSRTVDLSSIGAVYYRRPTRHTFPGLDNRSAAFAASEARNGFGGVLESLPGALYVNDPAQVARAEVKPRQLTVAAQLGFAVPASIVTNELDAARRFVRDSAPVVYKTLRSLPPDENGYVQTIWTQPVQSGDLDESIRVTSQLFQVEVDKVADVRVTVVGEQTFAVRIDAPSGVLDWRSAYDRLSYTFVEPEACMVRAMRTYLDRFRLVFGCFDFALAADGTWVFLECNPNGQWAWLPGAEDMARGFADVLQKGLQR